jgi:hypothetical protein
VAAGVGCGGNDSKKPEDTPTLDGSVWNTDSSFIDVMQDSDGDGVSDFLERVNGDTDSDGDGTPDYLDSDDDGDGQPTSAEKNLDTDRDGIPDYLDTDDDGDGKLSKDEIAAAGGASVDSDKDGTPDYLDDDRLLDVDAGVEKECAQTNATATLRKRPVDIVFIIDNSSSMDGEIRAVQNSINADFAKIIGESGIDYRVIMLGDFGFYDYTVAGSGDVDACSVCISGALNPMQTCPETENDAVYNVAPKTSERYFHYDPDGMEHSKNNSVGSRNSLCRALQWFKKPDGFGLAPNGWSQWLRKDASKIFVEITDDRSNCSVDLDGDGKNDLTIDDSVADPMNTNDKSGSYQAKQFDQALRTLSAEQFMSGTTRNYIFHSIISMPFKMGMMDAPYEPTEPAAATTNCTGGANPGKAYDGLSRLTGGLRYPVCAADQAAGSNNPAGFTAIFKRIAQGVVEGTKVACDFAVPQPPMGKTLDRNTVEVVYSKTGADPISFRQVQDVESCAGQSGSFYFKGDTIQLCSDTCTRVQSDNTAKVDVRFGCALPPRQEPPPLPDPPAPE